MSATGTTKISSGKYLVVNEKINLLKHKKSQRGLIWIDIDIRFLDRTDIY